MEDQTWEIEALPVIGYSTLKKKDRKRVVRVCGIWLCRNTREDLSRARIVTTLVTESSLQRGKSKRHAESGSKLLLRRAGHTLPYILRVSKRGGVVLVARYPIMAAYPPRRLRPVPRTGLHHLAGP